MLTENSIARIAHLVATGKGSHVMPYLATMIRKGAPWLEYRDQLREAFTPEFWELVFAECPWIEDERFGIGDSEAREVILAALADARALGVKARLLRTVWHDEAECADTIADLEREGVIAKAEVATGGRPSPKYWLAEFAPRDRSGDGTAENALNPFADWRAGPDVEPRKKKEWKRDD